MSNYHLPVMSVGNFVSTIRAPVSVLANSSWCIKALTVRQLPAIFLDVGYAIFLSNARYKSRLITLNSQRFLLCTTTITVTKLVLKLRKLTSQKRDLNLNDSDSMCSTTPCSPTCAPRPNR